MAESEAGTAFALPHTADALAAKKLNILVVGAGSSALPGAEGHRKAYPARLQGALARTLPGTAITVATDVEPHRTAEQMVRVLTPALSNTKRHLVIWQTGTVDAIRPLRRGVGKGGST